MTDFVELRKVIAIIARKWWLLILVTVIMAAAGYLVSQRQTRVYEGSVTLLVGSLLQGTQLDKNEIQVSEMLAQTYANLARRQPVLQGTIDTLNLSHTWTELRSRVSITLVEATQLLQIKVQTTSPEEARLTADEIARQLILLSPTTLEDQQQNEDEQFVYQRLSSLRARIEAGQSRLETLEAQVTGMVGSVPAEQLQELQVEINTLEGLIASWENSYSQFLTYVTDEQSPNVLAVIEPAYASSRPVRPRPLLNTLIAGAVGFGLALGLVFLLEFMNDTLNSGEELSQSLELASLGTIDLIKTSPVSPPRLHLGSLSLPGVGWLDRVRNGTNGDYDSGKLITGQDPFQPTAEAFRAVRSNIRFATANQPAESLLITSPDSGEGKSLVAANLGIVMAQAGQKIILVDANLRRPVLHQLFEVPQSEGLVDLLRSPRRGLTARLQNTKIKNLRVLTSGESPPNPSELLATEYMEKRLAELRKLADVVIVDSPPVSSAIDAALLANRVDGVVLVVQAGQTRKEAAIEAVQSLQLANPNLIGAVLNRSSSNGG